MPKPRPQPPSPILDGHLPPPALAPLPGTGERPEPQERPSNS